MHVIPPLICLLIVAVFLVCYFIVNPILRPGQRWKNPKADHPLLKENGKWKVQITSIDSYSVNFIRDDGNEGSHLIDTFRLIYNTRCKD